MSERNLAKQYAIEDNLDCCDITLEERHQREQAFFDKYASENAPSAVDFAPVLGKERRPWNAYWHVHEVALSHMQGGKKRLLDFGCGTGDIAIRFAKLGHETHGFDISPNNISIAQNLAGRYGLEKRTHFSVGVAEDIDYPSGYFDIIVGMAILHHVDIDLAMKECSRVLKKGGVAIFCEPIAVPVFDRVRNSRLGLALVPKVDISEDERKLTEDDLQILDRHFERVDMYRYILLSRFFRSQKGPGPKVQQLDAFILRSLPFLRMFAGYFVTVLRKRRK